MKNLPEDEAFKQLESRLGNYSELPDDAVWTAIKAEISARPDALVHWTNRAAALACITTLVWLGYSNSTIKKASFSLTPTSEVIDKVHQTADASNLNAETISSFDRHTISTNSTTEDHQVRSLGTNQSAAKTAFNKRRSPNEGDHKIFSDKRVNPGLDLQQYKDHVQSLTKCSPFLVVTGNTTRESEQTIQNDLKENKLNASLSVNNPDLKKDTLEDSLNDHQKKKTNPTDTPKIQKRPQDLRKKKKVGISVYGTFTPLLSFQNVTPYQHDGVEVSKFANPSIFSLNRAGLSIESGVQGKLSSRLEYIAGISLYYQSQQLNYTVETGKPTVIGTGKDSYTLPPGRSQQTVNYKMFNAGVQVGALYTLQQRRISHKVGARLSYQAGLSQNSGDLSYTNSGSYYLTYSILYRVEFRINDHLNVLIQPTVNHTLKSNEMLHAPFQLKQYQAGVGFGIVYHF